VDKRLDALGTGMARDLRGQAAIACARLAFQTYKELIASPRWRALATQGAHPQRLLWASTSTKDPAYSDIKYVEALIGPDTVNTLPVETLNAYRDHGEPVVRIEHGLDAARTLPGRLVALGVDFDEVALQLEAEGALKFAQSFDRLSASLARRRSETRPP
jgi:transaldolase